LGCRHYLLIIAVIYLALKSQLALAFLFMNLIAALKRACKSGLAREGDRAACI
jgi:hypothetical protein